MVNRRSGGRSSGTGATSKGGKASNCLYYGDNLEVMRKRVRDDSVDLCYMDPPFNSKRNYNQIYNNIGEDRAQAQAFIDTWKWDDHARAGHREILGNPNGRFPNQMVALIRGLHGVLGEGSLFAYLVGMSLRIVEIHRCLKPTGSFYMHCDPTSSHYLKLALDSVFCSSGGQFQNEITWRRTGSHNKMRRFGPIHDTILFYTKSDEYTWNYLKRPYMNGHMKMHFINAGGVWRTNYSGNVLTGSDLRGGESGKPWHGFDPSAKRRHWAIPKALLEDLDEDVDGLTQHQKLDRLLEMGFIKIVPGCEWPTYERLIKPTDGQYLSDIWASQPYTGGTVYGTEKDIDEDVRWLGTSDQERLGYPTQKPLGLLERIIRSSSNAGDVIMDPCCGCGTTIAAGHRLQRNWVGIDITYQSISLILKRLEDQTGVAAWPAVEKNISLSGIPKDIDSAVALAQKRDDRLRKEFEKWAVLTYTNNRGVVNEKKGADGGVDGRVYVMTGADESATMILQVKSGIVDRGDIAKLRGDMAREGAEMGTLITLTKPTGPMLAEAKAAGLFEHELMDRSYDKIRIVTVQQIVEEGKRIDIPMVKDLSKPTRRPKKGMDEPLLPGIDSQEPNHPEPVDMLSYLKKKAGDGAPMPKGAHGAKMHTKKKKDAP